MVLLITTCCSEVFISFDYFYKVEHAPEDVMEREAAKAARSAQMSATDAAMAAEIANDAAGKAARAARMAHVEAANAAEAAKAARAFKATMQPVSQNTSYDCFVGGIDL